MSTAIPTTEVRSPTNHRWISSPFISNSIEITGQLTKKTFQTYQYEHRPIQILKNPINPRIFFYHTSPN